MTGILLQNALVVTWSPPSIDPVDLRIEGDSVVERGEGLEPREGEEVLDLENQVVIPGMVCAHTHLYSTLARGLSMTASPPASFKDAMEKVWWRLDRALDLEMVEASALVGAMETAACGTTTLFDHHSSPAAIEGSLDHLRRGIDVTGIRAVLSYEVTDRGGAEEAEKGLEEHRKVPKEGLFRCAVGAAASFTLEPKTLEKCAALAKELDTGVHISVAESQVDTEETLAKYGAGLVERLRAAGVLGPKTMLAHAVHLAPGEFRVAAEPGSWFLHNPRANMHSGVGYAQSAAVQVHTALGAGGFLPDMFAEARFAYLKAQDAKAGIEAQRVLEMIQAGHHLASVYFGRPFGKLTPGDVADLVILDYDPPTPMTPENLASHLLWGMDTRHIRSVFAGGRFIIRDGRFAELDPHIVMKRGRAQARRLWEKLG